MLTIKVTKFSFVLVCIILENDREEAHTTIISSRIPPERRNNDQRV